jgi:programmed cell death 6-interacting protein
LTRAFFFFSGTAILAEAAHLEREYPLQKIEPAHFEDLFARRLDRYDSDIAMVKSETDEQEELLQKLKQANSAFLVARRGDSSTRDREQALQKLENAYLKYKEIVSNLDVGRKFYNDLAKMVTRFRNDCQSFAYQRRVEAGQLES